MTVKSGIGINYGQHINYLTYSSTDAAADLDYLYSLGFRTIRLNYPVYGDANYVPIYQALAVTALGKGFTVKWGCNAGSNFNATTWSAYKTYVSGTLAPWAQSVNNANLTLSLGNELATSADGSTITAATVRSDLRTLASTVKGTYTVGKVSYEAGESQLPSWISEGIGTMDEIGFNLYNTLATFESNVKKVVANFSGKSMVSEFGFVSLGFSDYANEQEWSIDLAQRLQILAQYHVSTANLFTYRDGSSGTSPDTFAMLLSTGNYRQAWLQLFSTRVIATPPSLLLPNHSSISANLSLWLKADAGAYSDAGSTPATNGIAVQQWNDQTANANNATQATIGNRPTYTTNVINGMPGLLFSFSAASVLECLDSVSLSPTSTVTVIAAVIPRQLKNASTMGIVMKDVGGTSATNPVYGFGIPASTNLSSPSANIVNSSNVGDAPVAGKGTLIANTPYILTQLYDNAANMLYVNGKQVQFDVLANNGISDTTGKLRIGGQKSGFSRSFDGYILEVLVYNTNLTQAQRAAVEAYLSNKWGIATITSRGTITTRSAASNRRPSTYSGLQFQNNTNVVNVTSSNAIKNLTAVTVEAWVNFTYNKSTNTWAILQGLSGSTGFNLNLNYPTFNFNIGNGTGTANKNSINLLANQGWVHVAGVWDGTNVQTFLNGVSGGTVALSGGNTGVGAATIVIGNSGGGNRAWLGILSELRISNIARYTSNFTPPTAPFVPDANTVALYHFTEGSGTLLTDSSGNALNGTLANSPIWTPGYFPGVVSARPIAS